MSPRERVCHWGKCGKVFIITHEGQKFCGPVCRTNYHNEKLMSWVNLKDGLSTEQIEQVVKFIQQLKGGA